MEKINIKSKNLSNYVMFMLDKIENSFTKEELNKITDVVINYNDEDDDDFLEDLLKLENIKSITLRNGYIFNDNYNIFLKLNNLTEIVFEKCEFENVNLITSLKLKSLSLINCKIEEYSFMSLLENLEELSIVNGTLEIKKLNMLKHLRYLQISYSNIIDNEKLNISSLVELYIDNTNIFVFDFLNNLSELKRISIDENQYNNNKDLFNDLMKENILVLNENMVEFGGENNEI